MENLRRARQATAEKVQAIMRQRDMYKALLAQMGVSSIPEVSGGAASSVEITPGSASALEVRLSLLAFSDFHNF